MISLSISKSKISLPASETCVCAAVRTSDDNIIIGKCHSDCLKQIIEMELYPQDQGFLTTAGRFVSRKTALHLQIAAGIPSTNGIYRDQLYSDDLPVV